MNLSCLEEIEKKEEGQTSAESHKYTLFLFSLCSVDLASQHNCRVTTLRKMRNCVAMNHESFHFSTISVSVPVSMACCVSFL